MLSLVVPDFVREHRFQFQLGQLLDQRVEQDDFPETSETGKERVRVARPLAAVHHLNGSGGEPGSFAQAEQAFAQGTLRQRRQFVE